MVGAATGVESAVGQASLLLGGHGIPRAVATCRGNSGTGGLCPGLKSFDCDQVIDLDLRGLGPSGVHAKRSGLEPIAYSLNGGSIRGRPLDGGELVG